jgi:DNA-binding response OmpR family regulator
VFIKARALRAQTTDMPAANDATVLVVEDSDTILQYLSTVLRRGGFSVRAAADGEAAVSAFYEQRPDLVVLDVWLPKMDGWGVLQKIRESDEAVPIIMLTASEQTEQAKVRGLMGGADDYLIKPVGAAELLARVTALLRRRRAGASAESIYDDGAVRVDFANSTVRINGTEISLTPLEFRLMATFVRRAGETLSPRELMELVWNDYTAATVDPVKVYVGYLRKKLAGAPGGNELIQTVRGFGYRYEVANGAAPGSSP